MSDEEGAYIAQELETFAMSEKSHAKKYIMLRAASFCREHSIIKADEKLKRIMPAMVGEAAGE